MANTSTDPRVIHAIPNKSVDELARVTRLLSLLADIFSADDLINLSLEGQAGLYELLSELETSCEQVFGSIIMGAGHE